MTLVCHGQWKGASCRCYVPSYLYPKNVGWYIWK